MGINVLVPEQELAQAFNGLKLEGVLKNGGQKNVFKASHEQYGDVVLKVFSSDMQRERVYREIGIEQRSISRIPRVHLAEERTFSTGTFFVALEQRIDGCDLGSYFSEHGVIDYPFAVRLLKEVLDILVSLEREHIVHRDIKPDNIIVDRTGNFWLIDFGAARDLAAKTVTLTGRCAPLTFGYAAPEQYDSSMRDFIDTRTDLFSLGVTVYTLLRGRNPFVRQSGMNPFEIAMTTQRYHATTLDIPNDTNHGLAKYLKLLMNKDIGARPPSALKAREWIAKFVGQEDS